MHFDDAEKAIVTTFKAGWDVHGLGVPVAYENVQFNPQVEEFVALYIREPGAEKIELGANGLVRLHGLIIFSVLAAMNVGKGRATRLADIVADVIFPDGTTFSADNSGRILCRQSYTDSVGSRGNHYQFDLVIPYIRDVRNN